MARLLKFVDAAYPPVPAIGDGVAYYIGGDTPHSWTNAEIAATTQRYRLPIYVRSNPPGPGAAADVAAAVTRLAQTGAPKGTLVAWDMETADDAAYIREVYRLLKAAGYLLIVYGSQAYVFGNDNPDGLYWGAAWTGTPRFQPGDVMTQFVSFKYYDESVAGDPAAGPPLPFWDTRPEGPAWQARALGKARALEADTAKLVKVIGSPVVPAATADIMTLARSASAGAAELARMLKAHQ